MKRKKIIKERGSPEVDGADHWNYCAKIASEHYENFTVGSRLLPRRLRRHMWAVYAYCRTVDDLGDEAPGDRMSLLDQWEDELRRCFAGTPRHPVMKALQQTVHTFDLDIEPFLKLIEANRRDQYIHRYDTFTDLLDYCEYSANPVGHIVLSLLHQNTPQTRPLSDATCTALQLTNFWQDVARDFDKGRIYIPHDDMKRFNCSADDLTKRPATPAFRRLLQFQVERTQQFFDQGEALLPIIAGRFRIDIALFGMGGRAILDAIQSANYDVINARPTLSQAAKTRLLWNALWRFGPWRKRL